MPFFKKTGDIIYTALLSVKSPGYELLEESHMQHTYPIDGWYWFTTLNEALATLSEAPVIIEDLTISQRQEQIWLKIKSCRDTRKFSGVYVEGHWFHSDSDSRIQQLGLVIAGNNLPPSLQWKTKSVGGDFRIPELVTMTPSLAAGIYMTTMLNDNATHQAAEVHRIAMLEEVVPEDYDYSAGWPASILDL